MKSLKILFKPLLLILLLTIIFTSCKKDTPTVSILGQWVGEYTIDDSPGSVFSIGMTLLSDGTISAFKGSDSNEYPISDTSWSLNDKNFSMQFTVDGIGVIRTFIGQFDNKTGQLKGTWISSQQKTGTWHANKK